MSNGRKRKQKVVPEPADPSQPSTSNAGNTPPVITLPEHPDYSKVLHDDILCTWEKWKNILAKHRLKVPLSMADKPGITASDRRAIQAWHAHLDRMLNVSVHFICTVAALGCGGLSPPPGKVILVGVLVSALVRPEDLSPIDLKGPRKLEKFETRRSAVTVSC